MSMFHIVRMMCDIFDHLFEQVISWKYRVDLAGVIVTLIAKKQNNKTSIYNRASRNAASNSTDLGIALMIKSS